MKQLKSCHFAHFCSINFLNFLTLYSVILESLRIGKSDARVSRGCILEGELVVYDDLVSLARSLILEYVD